MQISYHIGAHCTDDDRLVKSLLKNKGILSQSGVIVPGPGRYRPVLAEVIGKLRGERASAETQAMLLDTIMDVDRAERLVLSQANFLGVHSRALEHGTLYHLAADKVTRLRNLFPDYPVTFHIGLRNIATFVPALFELSEQTDFAAFLQGVDPNSLSWAGVVRRIRAAVPDCPVVVWCNEDAPVIWRDIMGAVAGVDEALPLTGALDMLDEITDPEGMRQLRVFLKDNPTEAADPRRRLLSLVLERYGLEDHVEEELDLPGWSFGLVERLTMAYDDDVAEIAEISGVTVLTA